jgi:ammonium transporter Rh
MIDVQNATLAGGVAVGAIADYVLQPWGAILIGTAAALLSVYGFARLQARLLKHFKIHDTCGVHNLHGMPGILSGVASAIGAAVASTSDYGNQLYVVFPARTPTDPSQTLVDAMAAEGLSVPTGDSRSAISQGGYQFAAVLVTFALAISSGLLTGWIIRMSVFDPPSMYFTDAEYWHMGEDHESAEDTGGDYDAGEYQMRVLSATSSVISDAVPASEV